MSAQAKTIFHAVVIAESKTIAKTPGRREDLAAWWASDTVAESEKAFDGLKFHAKDGRN
jgi:hypothetical protein